MPVTMGEISLTHQTVTFMSDKDPTHQAESEVDAAFAASPLLKLGFAQAVWTLLSVNEDALFKARTQASGAEDLHVFADNRLNELSYPLRICFANAPESEALRRAYVPEDYQHGLDWLKAARDYTQFSALFPLWHRKRIQLSLDGHRIIIDHGEDRKHEYEAYNRLVRKEGRPEVEPRPMPEALIDALRIGTTVRDGSFWVKFNPRLVARLKEWLAPVLGARQTLPDGWEFSGFTLQEFRAVISTLTVMMIAWAKTKEAVAAASMPGLGYPSSVWVVSREELVARLRRYTDVADGALTKILNLLTFGSSGVREPDIATQPLIDLRNGSLLVAPFVWMSIAAERNLCVLLNQIPEQRSIYAKLTNTKEAETIAEFKEKLAPLGFAFGYGDVAGTDVDLAIIDYPNKTCLCLQLKWFIEPAEIREINDRRKDIADGIRQAKTVNELHSRGDAKLMKTVLKIDGDYTFLSAVASQNWIGHGEMQDPDVPIIKVGHLLSKILEAKSLGAIIDWLRQRDYLPVEGKDYAIAPIEISSGGWQATWYGIKPLASE
jgi:hypothetical protein